jgi:glycosyltransferase involved in cell wall biosynthesis
LGPRTARMFSDAGLEAIAGALWPDPLTQLFHRGTIPFGRRLFAKYLAPVFAAKALSSLSRGDIAWILGPAVPRRPCPREEMQLKNRGIRYVFHIMDDWFSTPHLREATLARGKLADLIVVPTPDLLNKVSSELPGIRVACLEEPVDTDRIQPVRSAALDGAPTIVWTGNAANTRFLGVVAPVLGELYKKHAFKLRIISGRKPECHFGCPSEWLPYNYANESRLLEGALIGLSPLEDTTYNRSKGIFKVKTYMAAGIAVVGSDVGYQKHLVTQGSTGFLCRTQDDWLKYLTALLQEPEFARTMGHHAREEALLRFSHHAVADQWVAAVRGLVN